MADASVKPEGDGPELAALRRIVLWMSPWIDEQIVYHGAVLDDEEMDAYKRIHDARPVPSTTGDPK